MIDVTGKVVVITGASRGLGLGMAETMSSLDVRAALCARSPIAMPTAFTRTVDVVDADAVHEFARSVVAELGPIDLWINNAGVLDPIQFVRDLPTAALTQHLAINVGGVLHGTQAFVAHLRESERRGVLINISSGAALKGYAGWGAYCAGKAAVDRLTECIALEEPLVSAYAVAPGVVDADMQRTIRATSKEVFPAVDKFLQLKRDDAFNTPRFVAQELLRIAFESPPSTVVVRLPSEK